MKTCRMALLAFLAGGLGSHCEGQGIPPEGFVRKLPEHYVPATTMKVQLDFLPFDFTPFYGGVWENIPAGWSIGSSSIPPTGFDPEAGNIYWEFEVWCTFGIQIEYEVTAPYDQTGDVSFHGSCYYSVTPTGDGPAFLVPTGGDKTLSRAPQVVRLVPQDHARIQSAVDASSFGDTVMVSASDPLFSEHLVLKAGVNLVGYAELPCYKPPTLVSNSWPLPAITAAPYSKISGFIVAWSVCGIRVEDPTVEISNCVIIGTSTAAIEYVGATEGKITNCTIADNEGAGVLCHEASPNVVVSNSILVGTGGKDVENCTVRFSLIEDEIEPGSGENNISGDPMFANAAEGDYRLLRGSPCIDAGDNTGVAADAVDILSKPRILFGGKSQTVDIGACEYWYISLSRAPDSQELQLRWSSAPDKTYAVFYSTDFLTWQTAADSIPSGGSQTLWLDAIGWPPPVPARFYRITQNE